MTKLALVLGATGGIGRATARVLLAKGWRVRAMHRDPDKARRTSPLQGIEWVQGDAMNRNDMVAAAQGAGIILHGVNPPRYHNWRGLALPMLANTIEAALVTGARILFPGNIYNFGPDAGALIDEAAPQKPLTRKGRIRVEMERMLRAAAPLGARSIILRAGDFLGADAPGSWFQAAMVRPRKPVRAVVYPGARGVGHAWAYLPDLAETFAQLAAREQELPDFATFHFAGLALERGEEIAGAVARAVGRADLPVRRFPWIAVYALAPFVETFREVIEMRYLWRRTLQLDNTRLVAFLGGEPHTGLDQAVGATLAELGCLESPTVSRAAMTAA